MKIPHVYMETIEDFLSQTRIAMIGISHNPRDFSVHLFQEFRRRGYDMIPVNPNIAQIDGQACFKRVQDIVPPVQAAILMTSPEVTEEIVKDCVLAGIRRVWMYRAGSAGAVSLPAIEYCRDQGIEVVPGQCPFMFWKKNGAHSLHALVRKITGNYPRRQHASPA